MVVATAALCADRSAVAAPVSHARPQASRSFATKLTSSFRQSVAPAPIRMLPALTSEQAQTFALPIRQGASGVRSEFSPFQFRLPPPTN